MKINSDEHVIFAHKLQGALGWMVRFLNIYCEL